MGCVKGQRYGQYAKSTNGTYWNSTAAYDARDQGEKEERNYESHEVVSEFLAFALLLPGHPYSRDLYFSVVTVAPMYPRVIFVIGNAYEFTELCAQYGVRSFPKLLFFQKVHETIYTVLKIYLLCLMLLNFSYLGLLARKAY